MSKKINEKYIKRHEYLMWFGQLTYIMNKVKIHYKYESTKYRKK